MDYAKLQEELVGLLDWMQGPFVGYAHTYASNIVRNIGVGAQYGDSPEKATRTQLLYVINNLQGVALEDLMKVDSLCKKYGFDLFDAIREVLGENEEAEEEEPSN